MEGQITRRKYVRTGRVDWLRFIPWVFIITVVSALLACGMNWLYREGQYYVVMVPIVAGLIVGGLIYLAVQFGHCRSRWVAAFTGLFAGSLLYLGYYQAGIASELGLQGFARVDLLPEYIRFRMNSDVIQDADHPSVKERRAPLPGEHANPNEEQPEPVRKNSSGKTIENWATFAFEFACILFFAIAPGYVRARKGYCERCRKWMSQEVMGYMSDLGPSFLAAFNAGEFPTIVQAQPVVILKNTAYTGLAIDYCLSNPVNGTPCPIFFSIKDVGASPLAQASNFDTTPGKMVLDHIELTPPEIAGLAPRFPVLNTLTGMTRAVAATATAPPTASVDIKPSPPGPEGSALSRRNLIVGNLIAFSVIGMLLGGGVAVLGGLLFLAGPDNWPIALRISLTVILVILGLPVAIVGGIIGIKNPSALGNRYMLAVCRRILGRRTDRIVNINDPDAMFVESVPRKNWGRAMLETADDIGFLRIDAQRREILFEGDRERIRIPADAILSCDIQEVSAGGDAQRIGVVHAIVVVRASHNSAVWEWCVTSRWTDFVTNNENRRARAEELRYKILTLQPANLTQ